MVGGLGLILWRAFPVAGVPPEWPGTTNWWDVNERVRLRVPADARRFISKYVAAFNTHDWNDMYPLMAECQPKGWMLPVDVLKAELTDRDETFPFGKGLLKDEVWRVLDTVDCNGSPGLTLWLQLERGPRFDHATSDDYTQRTVWGVDIFYRDHQWWVDLSGFIGQHVELYGRDTELELIGRLNQKAVEIGLKQEPPAEVPGVPEWKRKWEERQRGSPSETSGDSGSLGRPK